MSSVALAPAPAVLPDYGGGSIVNLMASIALAFGAEVQGYPPLRMLGPSSLVSRNVVLLVVDGLGHDFLLAHRPDGVLAEHLAGPITSVFPSTTATAVTTFLTGMAPQQHAITGWFTHFRELGAVLAVLPFKPRHGGSAPAVSAAKLLDPMPLFDRLHARVHIVSPLRIVHSEFNSAYSGAARLHGYTTLDDLLGTVAALVRERGGRNYVYAYWPELDRLAHEHGTAAAATVAHLGELDAALDRFLLRIHGTDTSLIVTADHGFIDSLPEQRIALDDHPRLASTLLLPLCGESRVAYCYVQERRREEFGDCVRSLGPCVDPIESERLLESGYFGFGTPHPRLRERVGDYTLIMRESATIKDWLPGEKRYSHVGVHGGVSREEMLVPLIVAQV